MEGVDTNSNKVEDNGPAALQQDKIEITHPPLQPAMPPIADEPVDY